MAKKTSKRTPKTPPSEAAKASRAKAESRRSETSRQKNILANSPSARIKGHAHGAGRAAQAKRDSKPGAE